MAKKLDSIVELAAQKTREISANSGNYMAFLTPPPTTSSTISATSF